MSPLQHYTKRVLRRWYVVVALTVVGAVVSGIWAMTTATTAWTATAALTTQSQTRAPEQDAVLALGYVDYFNQDSYQQLLRTNAGIPEGVELSAKTGATSPILYIEAAGSDEDAVRAAAAAAAETFRNDVRTSLVDERQRAVADLQKQVDDYVAALQQRGRTPTEMSVILDQIRSLQGNLTEIQSDNTNLLKPLQSVPGTASVAPGPVTEIVTGAVGGALLGVLLALLLAVLDNRLRHGDDVRQGLGVETLAELDRKLAPAQRTRKLENLANALSLVSANGPAVVAVAGIRHSAAEFARELALSGSARRSGTLLVLADLRTPALRTGRGLVDVLDRRSDVTATRVVDPDGLLVLRAGDPSGRDPHALIEPDRLVEVVQEASALHGLVVLVAPPLLEASEGQVVCAAADQVILVVERGVSSTADAREALTLLRDVRAPVAGVVVDDPRPQAVLHEEDRAVPSAQQSAERPVQRPGQRPGQEAEGLQTATLPTMALPAVAGGATQRTTATPRTPPRGNAGTLDLQKPSPEQRDGAGRDGAGPVPSPRPGPRPSPRPRPDPVRVGPGRSE